MRIAVAVLIAGLAACSAEKPAAPVIAETFAGRAVQDPDLRRLIVAESQAYWRAIKAGNLLGAYERFAGDYRDRVSFEEWRQLKHRAWGRFPVIREIRWTQAAQRHHGPELYAIVTWSGRKNSAGSEGTLIWRQGPDGRFLLEDTIIRDRSKL